MNEEVELEFGRTNKSLRADGERKMAREDEASVYTAPLQPKRCTERRGQE